MPRMGNCPGIINKLKESCSCSDAQAYFIVWKYAPELLARQNLNTFQELADSYACFKKGNTEAYCNNWLIVDDEVRKGVMWLKGRLHQYKMLELYDQFYEEARGGEVAAFNSLIKNGAQFFKDGNSEQDDIIAFLRGVKLPDDTDEDEEGGDESE